MQSKKGASLAEAAREDMKARDIGVIDVRKLATVTDYMIIACGTSDRHVRSIAGRLVERAAAAGCEPFGVEGEEAGLR